MGSRRLFVLLGLGLVWLLVVVAGTASAASDGTVTSLAPLSAAQYGAAAAVLSDGQVLLVGGVDANDASVAPELYDPATNSWSPAAPPPDYQGSTGRERLATLPGNRALLLEPASEYSFDDVTAAIYDADTNSWTTAAPMPSEQIDPAVASLPGGDVLVAGGIGDSGTPSASEIYDPTSNSWSLAATMPKFGAAITVGSTDGSAIFLVYSVSGQDYLTETYDPAGGSWSADLPIPGVTASILAASMLPDGRIAMVGFPYVNSPAADFVYDPDTDTVATDTTAPIFDTPPIALTLPDGGVLLAAGERQSSVTEADGSVDTTGDELSASAIEWDPSAFDPAAALAPTISGTPVVGKPLTATSSASGSLSRIYKWLRCQPTCVQMGEVYIAPAGSPGPTYTPDTADVGATFEVEVSVTVGGQSATSAPTPPIAPPPDVYSVALPLTDVPLSLGSSDAEIPVQRTNDSSAGTVGYQLTFPTANVDGGFPPITGTLTFPAGIAEGMVPVPSSVDGVPVPSGLVQLSLDSPTDGTLSGGPPVDYQVQAAAYAIARDTSNPLQLTTATAEDPLAGARFFVDHDSIVARVAELWRSNKPSGSAELEKIASQPDTTRFGAWNGVHPGHAVGLFLDRAATQEPGSIPMISTYRIVDGQCHNGDDSVADAAAYATWIKSFAEGIGTHRAVLFLEMDSLITTPCLSKAGLAIRLNELRDAVADLAPDPHLVVYLDAGAADALSAARAATLLKAAGVADTAGFYLNATHFDWTSREITYGEKISRLIGGKHFVINTAENGRGPLVPRDRATQGNEILCNPPGRGLGADPTGNTGHAGVDAFAWIANPGVSGGRCRPGAPSTGKFWPAMAVSLAKRADTQVH
jgi:endoglucanase